jgi:N-acetylneuraminic acid mutarotase
LTLIRRIGFGILPVFLLAVTPAGRSMAAGPGPGRTDRMQHQGALTLEQRVAAQRAIEQVYWSHRIWPSENPGRKPDLAAVLSDSTIRERVVDSLRKSSALEKFWQRAITPEQLQAEMDRMAERSQDPRMLQELFTALGNDPRLIAETLARESLADRLIRNWYSTDDRFHGDLKSEAAEATAACDRVECMRSLGGVYSEATWRHGESGNLRRGLPGKAGEREDKTLDGAEWSALLERLAGALGGDPDALPVDRISRLVETPEGFVVTAVLWQEEDAVRTATVTWDKTSFYEWWQHERASLDGAIDESPFNFTPPALDPTPCTPGTWTRTNADTPPIARQGATSVWTGSEMIVWGGYSMLQGELYSGGRYNPSTDTWTPTELVQDAPPPRQSHSAVWTGTRMIVWGGFGIGGSLNTGGRYDPTSDTWTPTSTGTNVPSARFGHTAVWTGTQMIIWGAGGDSSGGRYDPSTDTWTPTSTGSNVPLARFEHTAVWTGTQMIIWGGSPVDGNSGGRYDPSTDTWTPTSKVTPAPSARTGHTAVWTGTRMIIWGGNPGDSSGGRYDPSTDMWAPTSTGSNVPSGRDYHTAVWTGTEMIVWGGFDQVSPPATNTGGRYNPSTDTWSSTATGAGTPVARRKHAAAWTGTEMVVWGGTTGGADMATGGRYSPSTDSWMPTPTGSGPSGRRFHRSVWTGAEMFVWGGSSTSGHVNTGGLYYPVTDSWRATSTGPNVPSPRVGASSLWTGTQVIVWGGGDAFQTLLVSGGLYNPASDTWLPTSIGTNVPTARYSHSIVWTGTKMIVWGGLSVHCEQICNGDCCYDLFNTGARYDPATNTWTPTSTGTNVPIPRYGHTAVWTGTQMVVWGGSDGSGTSMDTGGLYDPVLDTWLPTSTGANLPQARDAFKAAWTGTRMIVWGGQDEGNPTQFELSSGALYDPLADAWTTMSSLNPRRTRGGGTSVWTGTSFIVWGGYDLDDIGATIFVNTGAEYSPATDTWTPTAMGVPPPDPRAEHTAVWDGTEMIVWGGMRAFFSQELLADGARYCVCQGDTFSYRDADGDGYGDPALMSATCDGTIPAGFVSDNGDCNDADPAIHPGVPDAICDGIDDNCNGQPDDQYFSQPTPSDWLATSTTGAPLGRGRAAGTSTGSLLVVWGGERGSPTNTGGRYDPVTDTWLPMSTTGAPSARHSASAVWTGSQVLFWGGAVGGGFNDGGRYDPADDTWQGIAPFGSFINGRSLHSAVWTGSRMIIFGGYSGGGFPSVSGSYDPVANSWTPFTGTGAVPSPRAEHTAVWTGSRMVVWGGYDGTFYLATGSRYDPGTNAWSATATSPLLGRNRHTAVWTGSKMIVWGGMEAGLTSLGDGAAYDPGANTWTSISGVGAPSPRNQHHAVWTGSRMIVYGGWDESEVPLNDGGIYDPGTDSWGPLPMQNASPAQVSGVAAWVAGASSLVVWSGGWSYSNTGARYIAEPYSCGVGACVRQSGTVCTAGVVGYGCTPGPPGVEYCNSIDDNCDGIVDNGAAPPSGDVVVTATNQSDLTLSWSGPTGVGLFDIVRGDLVALRNSGGNFTTATTGCVADDFPGFSIDVPPDALPPGSGTFYLVRAVNCGGPGTYDGEAGQVGSRDAEIGASGLACP